MRTIKWVSRRVTNRKQLSSLDTVIMSTMLYHLNLQTFRTLQSYINKAVAEKLVVFCIVYWGDIFISTSKKKQSIKK